MEVENLLTFTNRSQLREWFERNHLSERCCWVACNRSKTALHFLGYQFHQLALLLSSAICR